MRPGTGGRMWTAGDPVPAFTARATNNPHFNFNTTAGRMVVLCLFGSAGLEKNKRAIDHITARPELDDVQCSFFGVSIDRDDEALVRVSQRLPGIRYFWDFDHQVSRLLGVMPEETRADGGQVYAPVTLILDQQLRVLEVIPLRDAAQHNAEFDAAFARAKQAYVAPMAPVLIVPRIFEPEFCRELIATYEKAGGSPSGFMREVDGKTVPMLDDKVKKRNDLVLEESAAFENLRQSIRARFARRLFPEIFKAYQYKVTRMERYLISCYEADSGGFFSPHRDNTTKGTAHRQFACTINLNAEEYEGGDLRFAEFGLQTYRAPTGGAVVFSCSLVHEAMPVTRGKRYAFLPFLYNEEMSALRQANLQFLSSEVVDRNKPQASAAPTPVQHSVLQMDDGDIMLP